MALENFHGLRQQEWPLLHQHHPPAWRHQPTPPHMAWSLQRMPLFREISCVVRTERTTDRTGAGLLASRVTTRCTACENQRKLLRALQNDHRPETVPLLDHRLEIVPLLDHRQGIEPLRACLPLAEGWRESQSRAWERRGISLSMRTEIYCLIGDTRPTWWHRTHSTR